MQKYNICYANGEAFALSTFFNCSAKDRNVATCSPSKRSTRRIARPGYPAEQHVPPGLVRSTKNEKKIYIHGGVRTPRGSVKRHVRTLPLYGVSLRTLGYVITYPRVRNYGP